MARWLDVGVRNILTIGYQSRYVEPHSQAQTLANQQLGAIRSNRKMNEYSDNNYIRKQAQFMQNNSDNQQAYEDAAWRLMTDTDETDGLSRDGSLTPEQLERAEEIASQVLENG